MRYERLKFVKQPTKVLMQQERKNNASCIINNNMNNNKHDRANFFTGTAYCNEVSDCKVKYKLSINRAIHEDKNGFIIKDVRKEGEHVHLVMKEQISGNDRITIATECILTANGSANKFVKKKVASFIKK